MQSGRPDCDTFPQSCILWLVAAGCRTSRTVLFLVGLDDPDNAGAVEDDSCQKSVKLAFLPPSTERHPQGENCRFWPSVPFSPNTCLSSTCRLLAHSPFSEMRMAKRFSFLGFSVVKQQWKAKARSGSTISLGTPTRRLEVETAKFDRVGGMVQRHFLAVGEAAFPSFRFCSFSGEQKANCNDFFFFGLNLVLLFCPLDLWSDKYCWRMCNYRESRTTLL